MWGCIGLAGHIQRSKGVPSLYVRVYRKRFRRNKIKNCSLTIREGVSVEPLTLDVFTTFPHYTWGCIALLERSATRQTVPSLYVRVYHIKPAISLAGMSSLTIREGVSEKQDDVKKSMQFPHYMWGCIDETAGDVENYSVPSLYVRVYRACLVRRLMCIRSLTIREGVSRRQIVWKTEAEFPHYTWGCIDELKIKLRVLFVSSLYVRVYHNAADGRVWQLRSLIIREGVSSGAGWICLTVRFPHYIWGCIDWKKTGHFTSIVPSLYVRVY